MSDKPNYKEGLKQTAKNVAAAGAGSYLGYHAGGIVAKKLLKSKSFRNKLKKMSKAERASFLRKADMTATGAGMAAGGLSSYALSNALNKKDAQEKTAQFFIFFAERNLV